MEVIWGLAARLVKGYIDPQCLSEELRLAPTRQISMRLPPDVIAWLKKRAKDDKRSLAFITTELVRAEIAREIRHERKAKG